MTDIYISAQSVVVWLGPAYNNSDLAMRETPNLSTLFSNVKDISHLERHTLVGHKFPVIEDPVWLAVMKLAFRNWFSRLWVVQEAVLAQEITVICGADRLDFGEIVRFTNYLRVCPVMDDIIFVNNYNYPPTDSSSVPCQSWKIFGI